MSDLHTAAMKKALEFVEYHSKYWNGEGQHPQEIATALRRALEQPAQKCSYPYCGCNSKAWCKVERNEALDKMAENAKEIGLDYEPAQEPVAWMRKDGMKAMPSDEKEAWLAEGSAFWREIVEDYTIPLYTRPQAREWVGLTDEQITKVIDKMPHGIRGWMSDWDLYEFTRAIEAAHNIFGDKNDAR